MRSAPSVTYPVGRCAFQGWLLIAIGVLAVLAWVLWWWLSAVPLTWLTAMGAAGWLLWSVLAWLSWRATPAGQLQWDALAVGSLENGRKGVWRWLGSDGSVHVLDKLVWALDAQGLILLRLRSGAGPGRWVWLEGRRDPLNWDALRRALMAHGR